MLESVLVPTYSEIPEPSPRTPLSYYRTSNDPNDPLFRLDMLDIPSADTCACRCGRTAGSGSSERSPLFVAEQRALAQRLRDAAERETAHASGGQAYKALYRPAAEAGA